MSLTKITGDSVQDASIVSADLSTNLIISLARTIEKANISSSSVGGNVNLDVVNSAVHYFSTATSANVTFNIRGNTTHTFNSVTSIGESASIVAIVKHNTERHIANVYIDGVLQAPYYSSNTRPDWKSISVGELNIFAYSIIKTDSSQYTVIASNTLFGLT